MVFGLFGRKIDPATDAVYAAIVAQARQPVFYLAFGVPDTMTARFDMIVAHVVVFCARFSDSAAPARARVQAALDRFFTDMDDSMRELGVSDTVVPKKMKTLASAYAGRSEAYGPALAVGDGAALGAALVRNVYAEAPAAPAAAALAAYFLAARDRLATAAEADLLDGRLPWPAGDDFAPAVSDQIPPARQDSPDAQA